jgi:hypothetical protein
MGISKPTISNEILYFEMLMVSSRGTRAGFKFISHLLKSPVTLIACTHESNVETMITVNPELSLP